MLRAAHVEPDAVWFDPDPGEEDGNLKVIIPDASTVELDTFVRRLYCPGEEEFYTAVANTPVPVPGTPDMFHTAVPQTPHHLVQCLDMIDVSLSLLKIERT